MCNKPLKAFYLGKKNNGKKDLVVTSNSVNHLEYYQGNWHKVYDSFVSSLSQKEVHNYELVPCGKCIACRLEHSQDWAIRCTLEMKEHEDNCFITLTYDDEHLPNPQLDYVDKNTGEIKTLNSNGYGSLSKRDLQNFFKKLRKKLGVKKIRYFACGEYGDTTHRPHYHIILFGYIPKDMRVFSRSKNGDMYYMSDELSSIWNLGHVTIAKATYDTCAYTARYVMKKSLGTSALLDYESAGVEPEFVVSSRKPGIARNYYDKYKERLFKEERQYVSTEKGAKGFKPFRYWKKLFEVEDPQAVEKLNEWNKLFSEDFKKLKLANTDKDYFDILLDDEYKLKQNSKKGRLCV